MINKIKLIFTLVGVLMFLPSKGYAQEAVFDSAVQTYLESNGTVVQYENAYDGLLKMLASRFPQTDANKEGWGYLTNSKERSVNEMKHLLVPIYQEIFSQDEILEMTVFYKSDAGVQLQKDSSQMSDSQKEALNTFYNSTLGEKIREKQPLLAERISKTSEDWSRNLYETAISLLKD